MGNIIGNAVAEIKDFFKKTKEPKRQYPLFIWNINYSYLERGKGNANINVGDCNILAESYANAEKAFMDIFPNEDYNFVGFNSRGKVTKVNLIAETVRDAITREWRETLARKENLENNMENNTKPQVYTRQTAEEKIHMGF